MIEKFSAEEIKQIMKELGMEKKPVPRKSFVLAEQKAKIPQIFTKDLYPGSGGKKPNGLSTDLDRSTICDQIFDSSCTIVDYTTGNLALGIDRYRQPEYRRKITIEEYDAPEYKEMFDEILGVIKKHYRWKQEA